MKKSGSYNYDYLIGKHKNDIADKMNIIINYYPSDIWTYDLCLGRFGREAMLYIFFEDQIVYNVEIKRMIRNR